MTISNSDWNKFTMSKIIKIVDDTHHNNLTMFELSRNMEFVGDCLI